MHPTNNRRLRAWHPFAALLVLAMLLLTWTATPAAARGAVWTVCAETCDFTSVGDAVAAAGDGDTIEIAPDTYTLTETIQVSAIALSLVGTDPATTIIQAHHCASGSEGCVHPGRRVVHTSGGANVHIEGLTIRHGYAAENSGGGIFVDGGSLAVLDSTITDNAAEGIGGGIAIFDGNVTISNATVADNVADNGALNFGGGIAIVQGELTITSSTISGNQASLVGGIYSHTSNLQISDSAVRGNSATSELLGFAGGIAIESGVASITGSLITENTAAFGGGGIAVTQLLDWGGGLPEPIGSPATVNISNSAIVGNEAVVGGGILLYDNTLTLTDSAIEDNNASRFIGGDAVYLVGSSPAPLLAAGNSFGDVAGLDDAAFEALIAGAPLILLGDADPLSHFLEQGTVTLSPVLRSLDVGASNSAPASGEAVTVTATLNQFDFAADPEPIESIATDAALDVRFTPDANTVALDEGVATTSKTLTGAQTITAAVVFGNGLGEYVSTLTGSVDVTWAAPPPPPVEEEPVPTPSPTPTATTGPTVTRTNPVFTPVLPDLPAIVQTTSTTGGSTRVTAPPSALPTGATLNAAAIDNIEELLTQAPPPPSAQLTLAFVIEATSEDGEPLTSFDTPIDLEFTVPADDIPEGADGTTLVLAFWNGSSWTEVEGTVTQNPDGSYTINASVDHFTIFSVFHQPDRGTFTVPLRDTGFTFTIWGGGNLEALEAALPDGATIWTWVDGLPFAYRPGLPAFVNARFLAHFATGIPSSTAVVVAR